MDFGMPSLIESKSLEECAALCQELRLSFIELSMEMPEYQPERVGLEKFAETAEGVRRSAARVREMGWL